MNDTTREELASLLPKLRRFAYGLTGSRDEGDDLVQSACERALGRLHQWRPGTRLDSWMYRIIQTVWIDRVRRQRFRLQAEPDSVERLEGGNTEREMEARLDLARVHRMVQRLPEQQRLVLMLVTVEGLSYKDAAAILDVPIGTVTSRLARARLELGRRLAESQPAAKAPALKVVE